MTRQTPSAAARPDDGSDILALARAAGIPGFKSQAQDAAGSTLSLAARLEGDQDGSELVALARAAGLEGFKRGGEE